MTYPSVYPHFQSFNSTVHCPRSIWQFSFFKMLCLFLWILILFMCCWKYCWPFLLNCLWLFRLFHHGFKDKSVNKKSLNLQWDCKCSVLGCFFCRNRQLVLARHGVEVPGKYGVITKTRQNNITVRKKECLEKKNQTHFVGKSTSGARIKLSL